MTTDGHPPETDTMQLAQVRSLTVGVHESASIGMCAMEAVSYIVGESWSDHPSCACPVISAFLRAWNDGLTDGERDSLLQPLILRVVDTRDPRMEEPRALMAADWLIRVQAVAWLRLAQARAAAEMLACLPRIASLAQLPAALGPIEIARRSAASARDGAWFMPANAASGADRTAFWGRASTAPWTLAASAAAQDAAAAARQAARAAALDAARDAIWATASPRASARLWNVALDAANDAAYAGAGMAGPEGLRATRDSLQRSAAALVIGMIEAR